METPKLQTNTNNVEKPTLVFLHYFGGAAASWEWLVKKLKPDFNCIALNLPGFGNSSPVANPTIRKYASFVADHLKIMDCRNYVLVGHSMGGKIALQCALDDINTANINRLILVAPSPPSIERMTKKQQKEMRAHPDYAESKASVIKDSLIKLSREKLELAIHTAMQVDILSRRWWVDEGMHHSIAEQTKLLHLPITVIASKTDPAISFKMTVEDTIPNLPVQTSLVVSTDIGHLIPLEDPEWLAEQIRLILAN